ncbi:mandelate racemase/muconate lactonizing enzyme family protein [Paeniroseomonas aquatica]|uniref:Mandelate racemase/muconate lactonizing enzyme family protein n=1 Tax=Paeniroseomonas aquatica TaxID=373043 RepID=A0ABT7ZZR7_9PROT|nr:mandelate racemase/muconate lactonizing enzyme family protein [Paeniroseomonas aquatica]MDN3562967.1 mandelate racemase/muconate lactonizing enzyme family protein [Paeniroseomonas aquatica]
MSTHIIRAESFVCRAPIAVPVVNAFGSMAERVAVFVRLTDADGVTGWGEIWSNFPTIGAEHRARLFDAFIAPRLLGRSISDPAAFWAEADRALHLWGLQAGEPGAFSAALAGADLALHDLLARRAGLPLWRWWGGTNSGPVPVYASGLNPGAQALAQVEEARAVGHRAFKIKIGFGEARDIATLRPVFDGRQADERVMVDINQGWELPAAMRMVRVLGEFPLTWIEEPLAADRPAWEWAQVAGSCSAPLAAGENLRGALDFYQALAGHHLGVVQPDCCKWGGASATLPVARAVVASGRAYCPHFLGGGIGQLASLHLLAVVRGNGMLEMDANPNPLRSLLIEPILRVTDGMVAVPAGSGLGIEPNVEAFDQYVTSRTSRDA